MSPPQTIRTPGGESLVVLPAEEYEDLVDELEALRELRRLDLGQSRVYPGSLIHAIHVDGVNPVRAVREWRGLTQAALAERVGTSTAYVSQIETGRRHPRPELCGRLAVALDVDPEILAPRQSAREPIGTEA
ncbi:MAG: helix-turn-helix transcriptional regulator [Azospirillaceae bacterium]